jgi:hypothetical protein
MITLLSYRNQNNFDFPKEASGPPCGWWFLQRDLGQSQPELKLRLGPTM